MALTDEGSGSIPATMLVGPTGFGGGMPYPVYGGGGNGGNNGWGDGNGWWIILLFILIAAMGGNWGGNNYGNGAFGGGAPIIVNDGGANGGAVQRGFDQAAVMSGINGVQNGVQSLSAQLCNCCGDISAQLCNGFAGVNATVNGGFANAETAANARQMANMQQIYGLSTQFADCLKKIVKKAKNNLVFTKYTVGSCAA